MSQRSHIAQSGRSAISACSAAWSDAEELRHRVEPLELRAARAGTRPPRSRSSSGGRSSADRASIVACVADRLALVGDDLLGHRRRGRSVSSSPSRRSTRSGSTIVGLGLLLHLRVPVAVERLDDARRARRGRARARGTARRGGGRRRPRGPSSTRARARRGRARVPVAPSTTVNESALAERSGTRAAG